MTDDDFLDDLGPDYPDEGGAAPRPLTPEVERAAVQPLNDTGNGQRLCIHFGAELMHVPRVGWHMWDGRRWAVDPDELGVRRLAQRVGPQIARETDALRAWAGPRPGCHMAPDDLRKVVGQRLTYAKNAGNSGPLRNMLSEASVHLSVPVEALDVQPLEVNVLNGTLRFELVDPGEGASPVAEVRLQPHDRAARITKLMPVAWEPDAPAPRFSAFLRRVQPDPEMRAFLQRWFGLALTGLIGEQKLTFFYGAGANGKSVMVDLMARVMGEYAATAKIESLTGRNRRGGADATPDLVPLIGARFVRASEPEEGAPLQEAIIKELTGGEPILVRALNKDFVSVRPIFKLTISGNHKPEIRGTDDGIWRRVLLVPWDVQIPPAERDPALTDKLFAEAPGVFAWMVQGLCDYLEGGLREPGSVQRATAEYREESDPIGSFLDSCCRAVPDASAVITSRDLMQAFRLWRLENGWSDWREGTITRRLKEALRRWRDRGTGLQVSEIKRSIMCYSGIEFVEPFGSRFRAAPRDSQGRILASQVAGADE